MIIYRKIAPKIWDDEKIACLDRTTKLIWVYLLTGRHTNSLPGLWHVSAAEIAEGLRIPIEDVKESLWILVGIGRVKIDVCNRLMLIPKAPRYNPADNAKVVRSWWSKWNELPDCDLRREHLANLATGIHSHRVLEAWNQTFGVIRGASLDDVFDDTAPDSAQLSLPRLDRVATDAVRAAADVVPKGSFVPAPAPADLLDLDPSQHPDPREEAPETARARVAEPVPTPTVAELPPVQAPTPTAAPPSTPRAALAVAAPTPPPSLTVAAPPTPRTEGLEPDGPPQNRIEVLVELMKHPALTQAATPRVAEVLLGRAIAGAKRLSWVAIAIAECARDAAAEDAAETPWGTAQMIKSLSKYVDRARPPKLDDGPSGPAGRPRKPWRGASTAQEGGSNILARAIPVNAPRPVQ